MIRSLFATLLLALASGCGGYESGTIAVLVTDAPLPFEDVRSAIVELDRITLDGGPYALGPARVLYEGVPISIELTSLRNGHVRHILSRKASPYTFRRMHLHFSSASLELSNGHRFSTEEGNLLLPDTGAAGFEVTIESPVTVRAGSWTRLLVDFDVPRSFVPQGTTDALQAQTFLLEPLVHAVRPGLTGEVRGIVSTTDESGNLVPVADATIYFMPSGIEALEMAAGSTATDADGTYTKLGLPPGTYDVVAVKGDAELRHNACLVDLAGYSVLDITLP